MNKVDLQLTNGLSSIIDGDDLNRVTKYSWRASKTTYNTWRAEARINKTLVRLHRFIMNAPKGLDVHHINHNTLDNRKCNLEICSRSKNLRQRQAINNETGVHKHHRRWVAQCSINNKTHLIGSYETKTEAIKARKEFVNGL